MTILSLNSQRQLPALRNTQRPHAQRPHAQRPQRLEPIGGDASNRPRSSNSSNLPSLSSIPIDNGQSTIIEQTHIVWLISAKKIEITMQGCGKGSIEEAIKEKIEMHERIPSMFQKLVPIRDTGTEWQLVIDIELSTDEWNKINIVDRYRALTDLLKQYRQADDFVRNLITDAINNAMKKQAEMLKKELTDLIDQESGGYSTLVPGSVIEKFMPKADEAVCSGMISQITVKKIIDEVCEDKIGRRRLDDRSYSKDFYIIHETLKKREGRLSHLGLPSSQSEALTPAFSSPRSSVSSS